MMMTMMRMEASTASRMAHQARPSSSAAGGPVAYTEEINQGRHLLIEINLDQQWPLLLTWFNFNLSMDK